MALCFAHLINPYNPGSSARAEGLLALTTDCLRNAAASPGENVNVILASAQFPEDHRFVPEGFVRTPDLERTFSAVSGTSSQKKLPLAADVIGRLAQFSEADFFIYTNCDIVLLPYFYKAVAEILDETGSDALIVNRRRVSEENLGKTAEEIFAEAGFPHPGYDCFVFRRSLLEKLDFGNTAIGVPGFGFLFAHNLFLHAQSCKVLYDRHLTLHLGYEIVREWSSQEEVNYQRKEIRSWLDRNKSQFRISQFPGYHYPFFRRHFRWLMNPLFHYPMMFRLDMRSLFDGRKIVRPEKRDRALQEWKARKLIFS